MPLRHLPPLRVLPRAGSTRGEPGRRAAAGRRPRHGAGRALRWDEPQRHHCALRLRLARGAPSCYLFITPTMSHCALRLRLARGAPARDAAPCYLLITRTMLPGCDRTALPGYHPCQVRVLEMPDKGRLLCATPPLRMSRQPFRLALNGRDFVSRATLEPALLTTLLLPTYHLPLTTYHVLPTGYYSPLTTHHSLLTAHHVPPTR